MKHLMQPALSRLCGQTCLAMILGVTTEKAVKLVRTGGGTRTKDLRGVLEDHGYTCSPRLQLGPPEGDGLFILKVRFDDRPNTHWVVLARHGDKALYYDPEFPCAWYKLPWGRVSSHMRISKPYSRWKSILKKEYAHQMRKKKERETPA